MSTIKDVAARAGVSVGTVSNLLNGVRYVSPETAERIRQAMIELAYRPNALARGLRSNRTRTVGLVVPDNANPFFAEVAWHIEQAFAARGFGMMLCNTGGAPGMEASSIELFLDKRVDGIIAVSTSGNSDALEAAISAGVPVVLLDREVSSVAADMIVVDNFQGGMLAARHLLGLGHRHLACITARSTISTGNSRLEGFLSTVAEAGVPLSEERIFRRDFHAISGYDATLELLKRDPNITAVFAANDLIALGAIRAAHDCQRQVPDDFSVVGFDDISLASLSVPRLTTIRQPMAEIASRAADVLVRRFANRELPADRSVLPVELVMRESTRPPR